MGCVPVVMEGWPEDSPGRRVGLLRKEAAAVQVEVRGEMVLWAEGQQEQRPGGLRGQRTADPGERLCIQGAQELGPRLRAALQQREVGPPAMGRGGFGGEGRGWAPGLCGFWGSLSSRKGSVPGTSQL